MQQATAFEILKSGQNVFLTGSAGAGKTYLLNRYIEYLREREIPLAITASTGIAATHIGGQTIHSWSGIGIRDFLTDEDLRSIAKKKPVRERIQQAKVLIIDEVSMLSGTLLSCVDQVLRYFKTSFEPFGGIQVILSGDFFQLPPVIRAEVDISERFAFMHPVWVEADLKICYLTEQHRQQQDPLLNILNEIRSGEVSDASFDTLMENMEQTAKSESEIECLKLFTHNADVDTLNAKALQALDWEAKEFQASTQGSSALVHSLKKSILAPEFLILKKHAKVMFVRNNYENGYLNGTLGIVVDFDNGGNPIVETTEGQRIIVQKERWSIDDEYGQAIALYEQFPLRLAWAITVHKSQGMTLDEAEVDLSKSFEPGQGYVALSRVKSISGLRLKACNERATTMNALVMRADRRFIELAEIYTEDFQNIPEGDKTQMIKNFIFESGGIMEEARIEKNRVDQNKKEAVVIKKKKPKVSTHVLTKELIEKGKNLSEISEERNLSLATIMNHLGKIKKEFPGLDLSRFCPPSQDCQTIHAFIKKHKPTCNEDFDRAGNLRLKIIYDGLGGKYNYDLIRLARDLAQ